MHNSGLIKSRLQLSNSTKSSWLSPPKDLVLRNDEVHVWLAIIAEEKAADFEKIISPEELAKAGQFRFARHKKRFIAGRGILRTILGKYLGMKPEQIDFEYNIYGKPSICGKLRDEIRFNLSHSKGLIVYAFSRGREIGIDIEFIESFLIDERTAAQCLTRQETEVLFMLDDNFRAQYFFNCWARKEAYLKACGKGLAFPANQIETLFSQEPSRMSVEKDWEIRRKEGWSFQKLPSIKGYKSALVVEGDNFKTKFWRLSADD